MSSQGIKSLAGTAILALVGCQAAAQATAVSDSTKIVMLGTGTPTAAPDRSGPAVAIGVNGRAYIVDAGAGVVRRAAGAARAGNRALVAANLDIVFLTHLHSDHTLGLPDLLLSAWVLGRAGPLPLFPPVRTPPTIPPTTPPRAPHLPPPLTTPPPP